MQGRRVASTAWVELSEVMIFSQHYGGFDGVAER